MLCANTGHSGSLCWLRIDPFPNPLGSIFFGSENSSDFERVGIKCYIASLAMKKLGSALVMVVAMLGGAREVWAVSGDAAEIKTAAGVSYDVFVTGLNKPRGLLIALSGDLYAVEQGAGTVVKVTSDGRVSRIAKGLSNPHDVDMDANGNLFVADTGNNRVAIVAPSGVVETYIGGLTVPVDLAFSPAGELLVCEYSAARVTAFKSPKDRRVFVSGFRPHGLAFLPGDITLVTDISGGRVMKVTSDGAMMSFATQVHVPIGIAIGPSGDVYVAERRAGRLLRIRSDGTRTVLLEGLMSPRDPAFDAAGNLLVAETDGGRILRLSGNF
jgi:sugar lactone lactonase YvrE